MGDRLAETEGDRDDQTLEESQGRASEGNITREDLLREQTEKLAEGEGDTGNQTPLEENEESLAESEVDTNHQTLDENQGRPSEGNKTSEDIFKEQLEMLKGMMRFLDKYEEDAGRAAEGTLRREDLLKKQIESLAEREEDIGDRTLEENEESLAEREGDTGDQTLEENEESLAESEVDTNYQTLDENQGRPDEGNRIFADLFKVLSGIPPEWNSTIQDLVKKQLGKPAEGNITRENLLREQTESLAESEVDTNHQTLDENQGRPPEWIRPFENFLKEQLAALQGMMSILDKGEVEAGAAPEWLFRAKDLMQEQINQMLGTGRKLLENTADLTDVEDIVKRQIDLTDAFRKIDDPTAEDLRETAAEWMEPLVDMVKDPIDRLAALRDNETPTEEDNEGFFPDLIGIVEDFMIAPINLAPYCRKIIDKIKDSDIGLLADIPLNVNNMKRNLTEAVAFLERNLDNLPGLPPEIRRMDKVSQNLFREALEAGKEKVYNIRLMVLGHLGVGKTTLTKRILGEEVAEAPHVSTEGIEIHPRCIKIDLDTKEWIVEGTEHRFSDTSQHLVNIVTGYVAHKSKKLTDGDNRVKKNTNTKQDQNDCIQQEEIGSFATGGAVTASFEPNIHETNIVLYRRQGDTGINKNRNKSDLNKFVRKCRTMTPSERVFCYVTMLDFAGQFAFYSTHQAFMSWRTLYLLVTDMSKGLDDVVKDDTCCMSLIEHSIKDYAVFWLNSIYSHGITAEASTQCEGRTQQETGNHEQSQSGEGKYPPVILVATHSDKVPEGEKEETKEEYFEEVRKILKERPLRFLLRECFAFSNFGPETDIDALKQKIVELAEQQDYWGEEIPGRWLALEQKLMELKRNGAKIIEYSLVEEINNLSDVKIENPAELEVFLRFEHDLGNIVFFPTRKLREKVVLDPEWLMDGVKLLISPQGDMRKDPYIYPHVQDFKNTGQLAKSLIGYIWSGCEHEDFHKNQEHLLDLLEKLSIIAKSVKQDGSVEKEYYWVPCVINKAAPDHVKNPKPCEGMTKTSTLCFESTTKFVHVGVFHRLVASFLSEWTPAQEQEGGKYHVYHGCCEFEVDQFHNLLLVQNDYVILATMFRYPSGGKYPDNKLCNRVRNLISSTLADITTCICPNSKFDIKVKCEISTDTTKGLHSSSDKTEKRCKCSSLRHSVNVADLMMFWEVGPEQSEIVYEDSEYDNQGDLHRTVLNRCHPELTKHLDIQSVLQFFQQKNLFDDVTLRDIREQKTTTEKIEEFIERVKQRGPKAYEMFKECLVETKQKHLLELLEHQEAEFQSHGNSC